VIRGSGLALFCLTVLTQACTIGAFSGRALSDGRPVLWKNRDVTDANQASRYFNDGAHAYVALIYPGETANAWAGINDAGFGIMNSNSFNLGSGSPEGIGDGLLMKHALQNCASVADFRCLLDSVPQKGGLSVPCNLGVVDSLGEAAIFEAGATTYTGWYCDSAASGCVVRSNFSMSGDTVGQRSYARYVRAEELVGRTVAAGRLSLDYLLDSLCKDLGAAGFDPYPLPYQGAVQNNPYGFLPTSGTINRNTTRAVAFIVGRKPGEPVDRAMIWLGLGEPILGLAIPLWVRAGAVPQEMLDAPRARLCETAKSFEAQVYTNAKYPNAVNSFALAPLARYLDSVQQDIRRATREQAAVWEEPGPTDFLKLEQEMAGRAMQGYAGRLGARVSEEPAFSPGVELQVRLDRSKGALEFRFPGDAGNQELVVHDVNGAEVASFGLAEYRTEGTGRLRWTPTTLPAGRYFASLTRSGRRYTTPFSFWQ
jgi:hypothetical protein